MTTATQTKAAKMAKQTTKRAQRTKAAGSRARARRAGEQGNPLDGCTYYASGSNHAGEIAGLADLGAAVGVTVDKINAEAVAQLEADAGRIDNLFVDSGAFGEVSFTKDCPTGAMKRGRPVQVPCAPYVKPGKAITDADWRERLAMYAQLGAAYGSKMVCCAPDKIADQKTTLARMSKYRKAVQALQAQGVGILVPVQGGELGMTDFFKRACWALGLNADQVIPAIPMKKGATPAKKVVEFIAATKPAKLHLLGMGNTNKSAPKLVKALRKASPDTAITLDSCLITASVGKSNGRANHPREELNGPRVLTQALQAVLAAAAAAGRTLTTAEHKRAAMNLAFAPAAV
jgi:hypothetical protein